MTAPDPDAGPFTSPPASPCATAGKGLSDTAAQRLPASLGRRDLGFEEGKNLEIRKAHAQGEIVRIPAVLQHHHDEGVDVIVAMTTPCLTAACSAASKTPVVFMYVRDPVAAGAGTSFTEHLPHVTGVGSFPPVGETIDVLQQPLPGVRCVGTLYNDAEADSRKVVSVARDLFRQRNLTLEEAAVFAFSLVFIAVVGGLLHVFLRTNLGTAMRAGGDNAQMITALGANVDSVEAAVAGWGGRCPAVSPGSLASGCVVWEWGWKGDSTLPSAVCRADSDRP